MSNLHEKCMIVHLTISKWTARKYDQKATESVTSQFNTKTDAGRFNKILIDHEALKRIDRFALEARNRHNAMSLPWNDGGDRILPAELYMEYTRRIQEAKVKFEAEVDSFIGQYEALKAEARVKLNGLFNEDDYPSLSALRGKFGIEVEVMPMPKAEDFRVDLNKMEVEAIRTDIEARTNKRINDAMKDAFAQLYEAASRIVDRCKDADAIFRDSLITNLRELLDVLPCLNITNDPALAKAIEEARPLAEVEPQTLRDEPDVRAETAKRAEKLARKLKGFLV